MKSILIRFNLIGAGALVLLTLCLMPAPAMACDHSDIQALCGYGNGGIVSGQSLRVNLANLIELEGREHNPVEVFAQVRLYDDQGRVLAQSAEVRILYKRFRTFNFNRASLPFPGEQGTGRLQVRVEVEVRAAEPFRLVREAAAKGLLPASFEIVDNSTGRTTASGWGRWETNIGLGSVRQPSAQ